MYQQYKDRVAFLGIYVREAHPIDGWATRGNEKAGINVTQPTDMKGRFEVARQCTAHLDLTVPLLVDEMDDRVGHAYSGMPDRLYLIDRDGKVAYKGGRGPFGYKPKELEQALVMHLLDMENAKGVSPRGLASPDGGRASRPPRPEGGVGKVRRPGKDAKR